MWKIKQSKYKNAFPKIPRKEEWIGETSANALLHSCGNHIKANETHMVFSTDSSVGSHLTVLPLSVSGRQDPNDFKHIFAHADFVTDFDISPCNGSALATCSSDCSVKIWDLPTEFEENISNSQQTIHGFAKRVENVLWNPCAENILAVTTEHFVKVYDVTSTEAKYEISSFGDQVQSVSWKLDGSCLVTSCKDTKLRIIDPRAQSVVQEGNGHAGIKDSRAIWCGDRDYVLTTGFDSQRQREAVLRDTRMGLKSVTSQLFDTASGVLMPLFDPDTNMLFLAGQGDTTLRYIEILERDPFMSAPTMDTINQVKGFGMVPKQAVHVMSGEVNRILLLTKHHVIPVPYIVPRKTYSEYHPDLYPDTYAAVPSMTAAQWCSGANTQRKRVSLDPLKKGSVAAATGSKPVIKAASAQVSGHAASPAPLKHKPAGAQPASPKSSTQSDGTTPAVSSEHNVTPAQVLMRERKPAKAFAGVRQSKFRHLEGKPVHQSQHINNIRNISHTIPGESDFFQANKKFGAVPLKGPGGLITILKVEEHGRLPDTGVPAIQNGSHVMDFVFDPFDDHRLAVACDDATVKIWQLPKGDIEGTLTEPEQVLTGHTEKLYFVRFHPLAKDLLVTAALDMSVKIWNLNTGKVEIELEGHTDTIFGIGWSPDGAQCATVCKDGQLRIYQPRATHVPVKVGKGPDGTRGARVVWVLDGKYLAVTGFDKTSIRSISVYKASDPTSALSSVDLTTSPSILIPHYDADSSTLFATGRGDTTIRAYEVSEEFPHLFELSDVSCSIPHQGLAFLPKNEIDVRNIEFAKALRLTSSSIEPISFTVPRVKKEFFQDDIFPKTRVTWEPTMTSEEWLSGANKPQKAFSLRPSDMRILSEAPKEAPKPKKYEDFQQYQSHYKTDEEKREELVGAMSQKLDVQDNPMPQDLAEGVDSDEWSD